MFDIEGTATDECPTSSITPRSEELVSIITAAKRAREFLGVPFGADSAEWEAWFYDAVQIIAIEEIKIDNARALAK